MVKYTYYFDTLLAAVNLRKIQNLEKKDLKVDVSFNKATLNFTPSRLNLLYFCPNSGTTFDTESDTLKEDLEKNPLKVTVYYKDAIVGEAVIPWPKKILENIDEGSDVLMDGANADLKLNDEVVGCVEVIIRLQCLCSRCEEEPTKTAEEEQEDEPNAMILADDIMFVMDDSEKCGQNQKPEDVEKDCKLNLSKYREINGKILVCPSLKNTCTSPQCLALKDMSDKFEKIVEKLVCSGLQDVRVNKKPPCGSKCSPEADSCAGGGGCSDGPGGKKSSGCEAPCGSSFEQSRRMSGMSDPYASQGGQNCSDKKHTSCSAPGNTGCGIQVAKSCQNQNEYTITCSKNIAKTWLNKPSKTPRCDRCYKEENLPNEWPNCGDRAECQCTSMKPKKPRSTNCPICKELLSGCFNSNKNKDETLHLCEPRTPEPRNCRVCYDDISWLPKNFPCPKCGNRSTSNLKKEYRETLKMIRQLAKRDNCR